eukprot:CAMPEP_0118669344 /NCGR_PEP_ID=MMETSP0785-20121206/20846_1 /TAXON_ID=91992 /ORGANISM="Bolidomonas pacifica, Strain CCMP 1866" /LENGTH=690 /DNA_ID=CAMNT_0006564011 /DNA_START=184 /DNA_END=2253 /DNA_ORIENTATION=+
MTVIYSPLILLNLLILILHLPSSLSYSSTSSSSSTSSIPQWPQSSFNSLPNFNYDKNSRQHPVDSINKVFGLNLYWQFVSWVRGNIIIDYPIIELTGRLIDLYGVRPPKEIVDAVYAANLHYVEVYCSFYDLYTRGVPNPYVPPGTPFDPSNTLNSTTQNYPSKPHDCDILLSLIDTPTSKLTMANQMITDGNNVVKNCERGIEGMLAYLSTVEIPRDTRSELIPEQASHTGFRHPTPTNLLGPSSSPLYHYYTLPSSSTITSTTPWHPRSQKLDLDPNLYQYYASKCWQGRGGNAFMRSWEGWWSPNTDENKRMYAFNKARRHFGQDGQSATQACMIAGESRNRLGDLYLSRVFLMMGCGMGSYSSCGQVGLMFMEHAVKDDDDIFHGKKVDKRGHNWREKYSRELEKKAIGEPYMTKNGRKDYLMLQAWRFAVMGCPEHDRVWDKWKGTDLGTGRGSGKGPKHQCSEHALAAMGLAYLDGFKSYMCKTKECEEFETMELRSNPVRAMRYMADAADGGVSSAWYYWGMMKMGYGQDGHKGYTYEVTAERRGEAQTAFIIGASQGHEGAIYRAILGWMATEDKVENCVMAVNAARSLVDRTAQKYMKWLALREGVPRKEGQHNMDAYYVGINILSRMGFEQATVLAAKEAERRGDITSAKMYYLISAQRGNFNSRVKLGDLWYDTGKGSG